ncbi:hypothetical protein EP7_000337 [Isosphaeraceae bacterium EP7]
MKRNHFEGLANSSLVGLALAAIGLVLLGAGALVAFAWMQTLPPAILRWLGQVMFVWVLLGGPIVARRFGFVRPWVTIDPEHESAAIRRGNVVAALVLQAVTLSFAIPLFAHPGASGISDWDYHLHAYEAVRRSIVEWGEFPWWDPWSCGGFPLAAEPQVGLASVDTPLVLALGTSVGLRLAAVAGIMIAVEGARRLARLWLNDPWAVAAVASIYGWNGSILIWTVGGHAIGMSFPFLPWMLRPAFLLHRGASQGVKLGLALAASALAIIQYPTAYGLVITAAVLGWGLLAQDVRGRARMARGLVIAAGLTLALSGWRLVLTGGIMVDYPRIRESGVDDSFWSVLRSTQERPTPTASWAEGLSGLVEFDAYIGPVALALAVVSLRRGWRWWHSLWMVGFALAMGARHWYQPSAWLASWPVFSTMHMVSRWRIPAMLGLGLAAADELQSWHRSPRLRRLIPLFAAAILVDLAVYAHQVLPAAFSLPPSAQIDPGPPLGHAFPVSLEFSQTPSGTSQAYPAVRGGYAVIRGYQPLLTYDRSRPTARLWRGHPDYKGEYLVDGEPTAPTSWSPNHVAFRVAPNAQVTLNANPGSWWWLETGNGELRPYGDLRCVELTLPFTVRADLRGDLLLRIQPPNLLWAAVTTIAGICLVLVGCVTGLWEHPRGRAGT